MSTYGNQYQYQNFNNPPYGTPAWHEQQARLRNAHKSPDPVLAQQQIAAAQPPALSAANPLPTTAIPPGSQVNPRQGPAPWQQFKDGALSFFQGNGSGPSQYISSQYGQQQSPVEAATFNMTSPENLGPRGPGILARPQPERYVPAPVEENRGMNPMTPEESAAFRLTPAGQRIYGSVPGGEMGDQTGGRRDSTALAAAKKTQHVSFAEAMGRYGGAIMNAGSQGGMAQVGAMGTVTGEIADIERTENRLQEERQDRQNEIQAREEAKKQEAYDKAIAEQQAGSDEMNQLDARFSQALAKFEIYDNVTGISPLDGLARASDWAGMNDSSRQGFRLELKQIIVDETLLSTAKTKGAVSDKEMALFGSGIPNMNDDEETWKAWLNQRRSWISYINNRMATGVQVSAGAEVGFPGYSAPETSQKQYSAEDDDALFNF